MLLIAYTINFFSIVLKFPMSVLVKFSLFCIISFHSHVAFSSTLNYDPEVPSEYTGINNVLVDGVFYNATFVDDFSGNLMVTEDFAQLASTALYDLIKEGGEFSGTTFDYTPSTTVGCESTACIYTSVFGGGYNGLSNVSVYSVTNAKQSVDFSDKVSSIGSLRTIDDASNMVYVQWTDVSAVPVPPAIWLMGSALLGLMGFSRKNKVQAAASA